MSKQFVGYQCDNCGKCFATQEQAITCEIGHDLEIRLDQLTDIVSKVIRNNDSLYVNSLHSKICAIIAEYIRHA